MLWSLLIGFINAIIKSLGYVLSLIVAILPSSPFQAIDNSSVTDYLGFLAWVIPFPTIISILQLWVTAIGVFYLQMIVLRWIKALD